MSNSYEKMKQWIASNYGRVHYEPEDWIDTFTETFASEDRFIFGLVDAVMAVTPLDWPEYFDIVVKRYTTKIVAEQKRSEREALASELQRFLSNFSSKTAGIASQLEEPYERLDDIRIDRAVKKRKRNDQIREYATWLETRETKPLQKRTEVYQQIRDHFRITLTDRRLQDILKSSR